MVSVILGAVVAVIAKTKSGGKKGDPKLAALDRGVLTVALMMAALDGEIHAVEYETFLALAHKCRGSTAKNVRELVDAAITKAGRLVAMAQIGVYDEKSRLKAFCDAAMEALPMGFANGSPADVRRAFVLWVAIGVADGTFSAIEYDAVSRLAELYADLKFAANAALAGACCSRVPAVGTAACVLATPMKRQPLLESDFIARAEKIVRRLALKVQRERAEAELEALINMADVPSGKKA